MKSLLLMLLMLAPGLSVYEAIAQEQQEETNEESDERNVESNEAAQAENEDAEPAPEGDNLRSRRLGDAFKNFQPSEEISADNAVTFPVDI